MALPPWMTISIQRPHRWCQEGGSVPRKVAAVAAAIVEAKDNDFEVEYLDQG